TENTLLKSWQSSPPKPSTSMTWERLKPIEAPSCTAHGQCPKQNNDGASIFLPIFNNSHSKIKEVTLWNLSIRRLRSFRRSLLPSVPVWLCGVWSTSWRGTAMTIPVPMLMCRKETQKNLIDSPTISVKKCLQMERTELYLSS